MMENISASEATMRAILGPAEELRTKHEAVMRTALGPIEELRKIVELRPAWLDQLEKQEFRPAWLCQFEKQELRPAWLRQFEDAQRSIADFNDRFQLPAISETARLLEQFRIDPAKDLLLTRFADQNTSLLRSMESLRAPWLDSQEQMRSIRGFAELQGIGAALQSASVFDETLSAALRVGLGDWRDTITWPKDIFTDLTARSEFYADLGFNHALTDFPAPAFEQSLDIAGLRSEPPTLVDIYGAPATPADDDAEEGLRRTNTAHDWLIRLETQLRDFIEKEMTRAFGAKWHKQRLPNGLFEVWQEKKQKAMQAGGKDWPLIAYADFTDYERVICKGDNWKEVFAEFFVSIGSVRESFQRLYPIRLDTMHARPIAQDDELLLYVETRRFVKVIRKRLD